MKTVYWALLVLGGVLWGATTTQATGYVGSEQCFQCHAEQFNQWQASGHPWKLRKAEKARYARLPLPPGYSWGDISYVIGGATKKSRYIDKQGYIITAAKDGSEAKTQYNLEDGSWSFYHKGEKTPYKCGPCHMTAYNPEGNQDGMPGMIGVWVEDGIGCEECHGPGDAHVKNPSAKNIKVDSTAEACGKCHQRGGLYNAPPAKGTFIQHHEQINELMIGPHKELNCMECHDPHQRAIHAKNNCAGCHEKAAASYANNIHSKSEIACFSCHMAKATKTAIEVNKYTGDVRSHIFRINTDPAADMFVTTEEKGKKVTVAKGFVTLDYACLGCHLSRDRQWAGKHARDIHK